MHFIAKLLIATAALSVAPVAASAGQLDCSRFAHTLVATVTGVQTTSSANPVNLPGAAITQIFSNDSCVAVEFSAQVRARSPNAVRVTVVSTGDEAKTAFPASADYSTTVSGYDGRAMVFVFPRLQGANTIQIKFESVDGTPVSISKGVMKVLFNNEA